MHVEYQYLSLEVLILIRSKKVFEDLAARQIFWLSERRNQYFFLGTYLWSLPLVRMQINCLLLSGCRAGVRCWFGGGGGQKEAEEEGDNLKDG
jgi:hypothetical protein